MKFFDDIQLSKNDFGLELVILLNPGWKEVARKFPKDKLSQALSSKIELGNYFLTPLHQEIEIREGEYGLMGITFSPQRIGIDLLPDQNCYMGHNLVQPLQIAAGLPVILRYIRDLERFDK
jgi:hypothetical protein